MTAEPRFPSAWQDGYRAGYASGLEGRPLPAERLPTMRWDYWCAFRDGHRDGTQDRAARDGKPMPAPCRAIVLRRDRPVDRGPWSALWG